MRSCRSLALSLLTLAACSGDRAPSGPPTTTQTTSGIACAVTTDCQARGGTCAQGRCTADNECAADADCAVREVCHADADFGGLCGAPGATPLPGPAWTCAADADCPTGQVCSSGTCGLAPPPPPPPPPPPACTVDTDCASGEICRADGVCVPDPRACVTDADCPGRGGYVCVAGQCGPASSQGCNGSNCPCDLLAQDCASGLKCYPAGNLITDGQCYAEGAQPAGGSCVEPPVDGPNGCAAGLLCVYASEQAPSGTCTALCATDADCGAGVCHHFDPAFQWGACTGAPPPPPPPPPPSCDPIAQDCAAGQLCTPRDLTPNECVPAGTGVEDDACTNASACSPGLACVAVAGTSPTATYFTLLQAYIDRGGGACKAICQTSADCAAGQACEPVTASNTGTPRSDLGICD